MAYTTTVTSKGQLTLPAEFRRLLNIQPGERLKLELRGDEVVVQKDDWLNSLHKLQAKNQAHLRERNIAAATDEELDLAIDAAAEKAAAARYRGVGAIGEKP
ncbi:MAG: AbrB/MazE/SpoVT family DNA-binding domain-containing protein [Mycobacteriales bacterium]